MLPNNSNLEFVSKLLEMAQEFEKKGNVQSALDTYNYALAQVPEDSILKKELLLIINQLEARSTFGSGIERPVAFEWSRARMWTSGFIGLAIIGFIVFLLATSDDLGTTVPTPMGTPVSKESPVPTASPIPAATTEVIPVTQEPTEVFSPTPSVIVLTVKARRVALRAGPDFNHPVISDFYLTGSEMIALEKHENWFYVEAPDGKRGWLFLGWLNFDSSLVDEIPSASSIPTPPLATIPPTRKPGVSYP